MKGAIGIALFALVSVAVAHPRGTGAQKAPANELTQEQAANEPTQLADFISNAQTTINNLGKQIQEQLNLPDQETVANTFKTQSTALVNNVRSYITQVSNAKTTSPELEQLWADIKGKLSKAFDDINAYIPNAQEQASQLQAKFNEGISVLVKESDKAAKAISQNSGKAQEDIAKFTKQAVEIAVQATQNLNDQLQKQASAAKAA